jgi:predicted nicotinamide N-methyase
MLGYLTGRGEISESTALVRHQLSLVAGELRLHQPSDAAELPDGGPIEWAPLVPYWSVLWRSGVALGRELARFRLAGLRVVELGCGLAVPSLVAAQAGAVVLATDASAEALELVDRNARENGVSIGTACVDWGAPEEVLARGPFDLVLAADVLYERVSVAQLLSLLPGLGTEVWLADPGRPLAAVFLEQARRRWSVESSVRDGIEIHRLRAIGRSSMGTTGTS